MPLSELIPTESEPNNMRCLESVWHVNPRRLTIRVVVFHVL